MKVLAYNRLKNTSVELAVEIAAYDVDALADSCSETSPLLKSASDRLKVALQLTAGAPEAKSTTGAAQLMVAGVTSCRMLAASRVMPSRRTLPVFSI